MTITFRVFGIPQTKGSTKTFMRPGMRFPVITNDNTKNKSWAATVSGEAMRVRPAALFLGPVRLHLIFHLPKPKSLPKRRVSWPTKKPDLSKTTRSVEDALTGIIWRDDAQVVQSSQEKIYSDAPGVEIMVTPIDLEVPGNGGSLL
jgi:Holliday junction resolvase RusA-like endonuclease